MTEMQYTHACERMRELRALAAQDRLARETREPRRLRRRLGRLLIVAGHRLVDQPVRAYTAAYEDAVAVVNEYW